jgi:hypothetical protein
MRLHRSVRLSRPRGDAVLKLFSAKSNRETEYGVTYASLKECLFLLYVTSSTMYIEFSITYVQGNKYLP